MKAIIRQYVIPALIFAVFLFTLVVVSARSFLPGDMAQPAPMGEMELSLDVGGMYPDNALAYGAELSVPAISPTPTSFV